MCGWGLAVEIDDCVYGGWYVEMGDGRGGGVDVRKWMIVWMVIGLRP